ncbi:hypothetical protein D5086_007611 [Populus alba]|uniref:Uncharacterized protein n=1 Tax=Populus alba TaxID=43335 RepID=A0ACC4CNY3_POPAL
MLANETFTFYSSHGRHTALEDITFGRSTDSINVNGVKLNISKTDLAIEEDGGGGCVIDCGALAPTLLVKPIFDTLHTAMADHLSSNQNLKRRIIHKDLCCEELSDDGRKNLPVATFHFENADLDVKPEAVFMFLEF